MKKHQIDTTQYEIILQQVIANILSMKDEYKKKASILKKSYTDTLNKMKEHYSRNLEEEKQKIIEEQNIKQTQKTKEIKYKTIEETKNYY